MVFTLPVLLRLTTTEPVIPPPKKIFLHKGEDGWQTDHHEKQIGLSIGRIIDEELKAS